MFRKHFRCACESWWTNKKICRRDRTKLNRTVRRWCDFYCFVLWLHLGPCHVSIQFVFLPVYSATSGFPSPEMNGERDVCRRLHIIVMFVCDVRAGSGCAAHQKWREFRIELNEHRLNVSIASHPASTQHTYLQFVCAKKGTKKGILICHTTHSHTALVHFWVFEHHQIIWIEKDKMLVRGKKTGNLSVPKRINKTHCSARTLQNNRFNAESAEQKKQKVAIIICTLSHLKFISFRFVAGVMNMNRRIWCTHSIVCARAHFLNGI